MKFTGIIQNVSIDWTGKNNITFTVNEPSALEEVSNLKDCKLSIEAEEYKEKRSLNANGMLWSCLDRIAKAMTPPADKWDIYLQMLKRYGKFTYICVKPNVVEAVKKQWRECEVIGEVNINGQTAVQMLCYFGSSTMDTKEFSVLLDGVVSEMREMKLPVPPTGDMRRAIELWEKQRKAS